MAFSVSSVNPGLGITTMSAPLFNKPLFNRNASRRIRLNLLRLGELPNFLPTTRPSLETELPFDSANIFNWLLPYLTPLSKTSWNSFRLRNRSFLEKPWSIFAILIVLNHIFKEKRNPLIAISFNLHFSLTVCSLLIKYSLKFGSLFSHQISKTHHKKSQYHRV